MNEIRSEFNDVVREPAYDQQPEDDDKQLECLHVGLHRLEGRFGSFRQICRILVGISVATRGGFVDSIFVHDSRSGNNHVHNTGHDSSSEENGNVGIDSVH